MKGSNPTVCFSSLWIISSLNSPLIPYQPGMKNQTSEGYQVVKENVMAVSDDYKTRNELEEVRLSIIQILNFVNHFGMLSLV